MPDAAMLRTQDDPPALRTALVLLEQGLWPVAIYGPKDRRATSPGKQPIGVAWGKSRPTEESLRTTWAEYPDAGVGLKLGADGGVIDIEVDQPGGGEAALLELLGGEIVETMGWVSNRGPHLLFRWDKRLAKYGRTKVDYHGVELRIGTLDAARPMQLQSVVPPTPKGDGSPRQWNEYNQIAPVPESVFAVLDRLYPPPEKPRPTIPFGSNDRTLRRARAYVLSPRFPDSIEGQRGHDKIFNAACRLVDGFGLSYAQAMPILQEYNALKANPSESERQLDHKLRDALKTYTVPSLKQLNDPQFAQDTPTHKNKRSFDGIEGIEGGTELISELETWDEPRLHESLPAIPFPLDVFPGLLRDLCLQGAASVQCPVDYFGAAALALAGAVVGQSVSLRVKAHYIEGPALYLAMVGPPGTKKSPVLKIMARPLWEIDRDLRERYIEEKRAYEARKDAPDAPEPPIHRQLTLDDSTREAVAQIHAQNPRGLALIKDELTAWVASLNAYRNGKGDDLQFWLKCNSGALVKVNRKGSPEPIIVARPCVTIFGGLTPGTLPTMGSGRDDGWLDRILFSYPQPVTVDDWSEVEIPDDLVTDWDGAIRRLWSRGMVFDPHGRPVPFEVGMEEPARATWRAWINRHRAELRDPDNRAEVYSGPWSKMESFAARMALILSRLHQAYDPTDDRVPHAVSALDVWGATRLADYFKAHFKRARAELVGGAHVVPGDVVAVLDWIKNTGRREFSERDCKNNFHSRFKHDPFALVDALEWLRARRCIRAKAVDRKSIGRPHSGVWEVNPKLLSPDSWLKTWLQGGLFRPETVLARGKEYGFTEEQVDAAAVRLGVACRRRDGHDWWGLPGEAYWSLYDDWEDT
jgi:hypothetical protein